MNSVALANVKRVDELIWHGSEMSQKLGHPPVMYMKLGTADTIVVNTVRAQADLMEKKGAIYRIDLASSFRPSSFRALASWQFRRHLTVYTTCG